MGTNLIDDNDTRHLTDFHTGYVVH
jgi:hypothetical protein